MLPITGTATAPGRRGALSVGGLEGHRELRIGRRVAAVLPRDVSGVSIRGACHGPATDHYLIGVAVRPAEGCALRYQLVDVGRRGAPRIGPRFGSCVAAASLSLVGGQPLVEMAIEPGSAATVVYHSVGARMVPVTAAMLPSPGAEVPVTARRRETLAAWTASPACSVVARDAKFRDEARAADATLADFERRWPREWRSRGRIDDQPLTSLGVRSMVTDLACLAALPGGERVAMRTARPLFGSRRHGRQAFEQLDEVARGSGVDPAIRAAARTFHAQMRYTVEEPRLE